MPASLQYLEFRLELRPHFGGPGAAEPDDCAGAAWPVRALAGLAARAARKWDVQVTAPHPLEILSGPKGTVTLKVRRADLRALQFAPGDVGEALLVRIGRAVWASLMSCHAEEAYDACLAYAASRGMGLKLTVELPDESGVAGPPAGEIRMADLPIELVRHAIHGSEAFLASRRDTPVCRSLVPSADAESHKLGGGRLRVLVIVSTPADRTRANAGKEMEAIEKALHKIAVPRGRVEMMICHPATMKHLDDLLYNQESGPWHVVHFIGHGGFDDGVPKLYFMNERGASLAFGAEAFSAKFAGMPELRLVVLTACRSSAPPERPDEQGWRYGPSAFDGIVHKLVDGFSGLTAAVAMQFDLESEAAQTFSEAFYANLLYGDRSIDEAVALARGQLIGKYNYGHRAWITPTVYSRCRGGRVFDTAAASPIAGGAATELDQLEGSIRAYSRAAALQEEENKTYPDGANSLFYYEEKLRELKDRQLDLLGRAIQLLGVGHARPGDEVSSTVRIRLDARAALTSVRFRVRFDPGRLSHAPLSTANSMSGVDFRVERAADGALDVTAVPPRDRGEWQPGLYDLGKIGFRVAPDCPTGLIELKIEDAPRVEWGGPAGPFSPINGYIFVG